MKTKLHELCHYPFQLCLTPSPSNPRNPQRYISQLVTLLPHPAVIRFLRIPTPQIKPNLRPPNIHLLHRIRHLPPNKSHLAPPASPPRRNPYAWQPYFVPQTDSYSSLASSSPTKQPNQTLPHRQDQ